MNPNETTSGWHRLYPCSEGCGFIGSLDAFADGQCYSPCPNCGADRTARTGRFIYQLEPVRWLPFIKEKKFVRVEWREENAK